MARSPESLTFPGADQGPSARVWVPLLVVVVAGAVAFRALTLGAGLPFVGGDERQHFVGEALTYFGGDYNPRYFINPPALSYLLHAVFAVGWLGDGAVAARMTDPDAVFTVARGVTAAIGVLGVVAVFLAGRRIGDTVGGLAAAALAAFSLVAITYSQLALNDVPAMVASAFALWAAAGCLTDGELARRRVALAGGLVGLAATTKYTAGIAVLPLAVVLAFRLLTRRSFRATIAEVLVAGVAAGAVFVLLNPFALADPGFFLGQLRSQSDTSNVSKLGQPGGDGIGFYLETVTWSLGWVAAALIVVGAFVALRRRWIVAVMLLLPIALYLLYMGSHTRYFARWLLPVYPHLCVLGGLGFAALLRPLLGAARRLGPAVLAVGLAALVAQPVAAAVRNVVLRERETVNESAHAWMVQNVPKGTKVALDPLLPQDFGLLEPGGDRPRWQSWTAVHPPTPKAGLADDFIATLRPSLLDRYREEGFCWVVTSENSYGRVMLDERLAPEAAEYYRALRAAGGVAATFSPYREGEVAPGVSPVAFRFDRMVFLRYAAYERPGVAMIVQRLRGDGC